MTHPRPYFYRFWFAYMLVMLYAGFTLACHLPWWWGFDLAWRGAVAGLYSFLLMLQG